MKTHRAVIQMLFERQNVALYKMAKKIYLHSTVLRKKACKIRFVVGRYLLSSTYTKENVLGGTFFLFIFFREFFMLNLEVFLFFL